MRVIFEGLEQIPLLRISPSNIWSFVSDNNILKLRGQAVKTHTQYHKPQKCTSQTAVQASKHATQAICFLKHASYQEY